MSDAWGNIAVTPQIIGSDVSTMAAATITLTANNVYLYAFELYATTVIVGTRWRNGAAPTGSTNMGIYTSAGSKVVSSDTGAQLDVASTTTSFSYATPLSLLPGQYFVALSCSAADAFQGVSPLSTDLARARRATNTLAAGVLPAATGAVISTSFAPGMALLVSGGLT